MQDNACPQVFVRIFQVSSLGAELPAPAYEAGPISIDPGRIATLTHNLGGNPQDYLVDLRCWIASDVEGSIHNRGVGGDDASAGMKGVTWYLDNSGGDATIRIQRQDHDTVCPQVFVRIWNVYSPDATLDLTGTISGSVVRANDSACDPSIFPHLCREVSLCPTGTAWDDSRCTKHAVAEDGTFSFLDVPPGAYTIHVVCGSCYI